MKAVLSLLVFAAACAHAENAQPVRKAHERVLVTGSRIPRPVDARTGLPETFGPVRVYSSDRLVETGHGPNLAQALHSLDPSF